MPAIRSQNLKKDSKIFVLQNSHFMSKLTLSSNRMHSCKMKTTQRSVYNKQNNISLSINENENGVQETNKGFYIEIDIS